MSESQPARRVSHAGWHATASALCAILVGIGLARFAYTPLIPALVEAGWFTPAQAAYLGAANLAALSRRGACRTRARRTDPDPDPAARDDALRRGLVLRLRRASGLLLVHRLALRLRPCRGGPDGDRPAGGPAVRSGAAARVRGRGDLHRRRARDRGLRHAGAAVASRWIAADLDP